MTILKYGLIGLTSSIYFLKRFKGLGAYTIIFSLLYAMSEYVLLNMRNVMWMDAVIVLPLVFLGVYQLVNQHRTLLLYGSLFLAVVINWYSGYMVCLMAFCYFLFEYFSWANHRFKLRTFLPKISRFIAIGILSVLSTFFLFVPNLLSLATGKGSIDVNDFNFEIRHTAAASFKALLPNTEFEFINTGIIFYAGSLMVILMAYYFMSHSVPLKEKLFNGALTIFFLLVPTFSTTDTIWTTLKHAYSYGTRYSFCFVLYFLVISVKGFLAYKADQNRRLLGKTLLVVLAFYLIIEGASPYSKMNYIGFLMIILYTIVLGWNINRQKSQLVLMVLLGLLSIESLKVTSSYFHFLYFISNAEFETYTQKTTAELEHLKQIDPSVYRFERMFNRTGAYRENKVVNGEALSLQIPGVQHYTSTYDGITNEITDRLGYNISDNIEINYNDSILPSDALLGIKYLYAKEQQSGYKLIKAYDGYDLYENPYALPLGFMVAPANDTSLEISKEDNAFVYQNKLFSTLVGREFEVFEPVTGVSDQKNGSTMTFDLPSLAGEVLYAQFTSADRSEKQLLKNGEVFRKLSGVFSEGVVDLKNDHADSNPDQSGIKLAVEKAPEDLKMVVYKLNSDVLKEVAADLNDQPLEVSQRENNVFAGSIDVIKAGQLLITLPYDDGWQVKVNGEAVAYHNHNGFMAIDLASGTQKIHLVYYPKGLVVGSIVSVLAVTTYVVVFVFLPKRREVRKNKAL